jgi:hypothetical protein
MDDRSLKVRLDKYFSQEVTLRQTEKSKALGVWEGPVREILERVKEKDFRFDLKQFFSGSYYERAKVKEPNEFDLMLEVESLKLGAWDPYYGDEDNLSGDPPTGA